MTLLSLPIRLHMQIWTWPSQFTLKPDKNREVLGVNCMAWRVQLEKGAEIFFQVLGISLRFINVYMMAFMRLHGV
jgi:hypothetical protein